MANESTVQLAPDSVTPNKNLFRVVEILSPETLAEYITSGFTPMQEVVVLADDQGNIVGVCDGSSLSVADEQVRTLLNGICTRLDVLIGIQGDDADFVDDGCGLLSNNT